MTNHGREDIILHNSNNKDLMYLSTVIGVCGENFCTFFADSRKIESVGAEFQIANDNTKKILKFNEKVLFGATGLLRKDEEILDPFKGTHRKKLTASDALKAAKIYAKTIADNDKLPLLARNYLIGGKYGGKFCIHEIHINPETREVEPGVKQPGHNEFGISVCLPRGLAAQVDRWTSRIEACIKSSRTHDEMTRKVSMVITEIAKVDASVGGEVYTLSIF